MRVAGVLQIAKLYLYIQVSISLIKFNCVINASAILILIACYTDNVNSDAILLPAPP